MKLIAFLLLIPAIACYSLSQLAQHGKIKWKSKDPHGFWGESMDRRKYKNFSTVAGERWFTSTNVTVFLTDGYHLMQFFMFISLSVSITFAAGFDWWLLAGVWSGIHVVHAGVYKILQRRS